MAVNLSSEFKSKVLLECKNLIAEKIASLTSTLNDLIEAANSETKSSAGDKYETARSMMQLEQEKLRKQLSEVQDQKNQLEKIDPLASPPKITAGSLVETDHALFFIATSIGKIEVEKIQVLVISPASPIAAHLMNAQKPGSFTFNNLKYVIKNFA